MRATVVALALVSMTALASDTPQRGWKAGTPAANAASWMAGTTERPVLALPKVVTDAMRGPTVLFYFSPGCPHCQHVAGEVEALSLRIKGAAVVLGVAAGGADPAELTAFRTAFGVTFPIVIDEDRALQSALNLQSTPSVALVAPAKKKGEVEVRDLWLPYLPGWDALVEARLTGQPFAAYRPGAYQGNNACLVCHTQEYASYKLTHHAIAWRTLALKDKTKDKACTGCHVTGDGQPGGWAGDENDKLVDVGCESCHGPGGPHDGTRLDARTTCATCHDDKHSIAFTVDKGMPFIDHYKATGLSDVEYQAQRKKLYAGEIPRELLAFPTGKNVGSAACLTCHAVEHAWWASSPHANAMGSLKKEGSTDPACVRCHATATRSGPPPTELAGFDRLGGVGCESCHGPGEAHVSAAGGTDNIQGLGDSCPVCVIEAVCTSCHTPTWSPAWNLETALPKVAHTLPTP